MTDRDNVSESLTGRWNGYYMQHDDQHRIVATLVQEGEQISGTMRDLDVENEQTLFDAVAHAGLPPGADEKIAEQIREMISDAGDGPITTRAVLSEESKLDGTVSGVFVRFKKSYQGETSHAYEIGDQGIRETTPGHSVEYSGRISGDGSSISGKWTIYQAGIPRGFIDGGFELRRAAT